MSITKRRGLVAFAAVLSTMAVSGIGASGASAALGAKCSGTSITGQGSTLQGAAQDNWTVTFNTHAAGCVGGPTVTYDRSSSGACLTGIGATRDPINKTFAFCGTDDAPSAAERETSSTTAGGAQVLTIPVAQSAIAVVVNPPAGCMVNGTVTPAQVEQAFRGTTANWTTLGGGAGVAACDVPINRVVRDDNSGTTYQFKRYLGTVNGATVHAGTSWTGLQGGANNTTWPHPASGTSPLVTSTSGCTSFMTLPCSGTGSGGSDEVRTVGATPGSIGYAALSDARSVIAANEATWPTLSWLRINTSGLGVDPSTPAGFATTKGASNCSTVNGSYTNPSNAVPTATGDWSNVYLTNPNNLYPICTLTWDLAFNNYTTAGYTHGTGIARTVTDYLHYAVTTTGGGQATGLGAESDYAQLPEDVRTAATAGILEIGD